MYPLSNLSISIAPLEESETEEEPSPAASEESDETESDDDDDDDEDGQSTVSLRKCDDCGTNIAAADCDYGCCGRCCRSPSYGRSRICSRHNPEEEEEEGPVMNEDGSCRFCPNVAARNCENFCCGKCCNQEGEMYCSRHN